MAKRELWNGYRPLRPWERLFAYISAVTMFGLTWHQANSEALSLELLLYTASLLIAVPCAFIAFWDARVTARLRRRELKRREQIHRQMQHTPNTEAVFRNATGQWEFFHDPMPTTN